MRRYHESFTNLACSSTDMFAESLLLAERGVGPHEIVSLFEDIYATGIRAPNQAELGLLSRITDFEVDQIEAFCKCPSAHIVLKMR